MPPNSPIPKKIQKTPFSYAEAKAYGVSRNDIQAWLKLGKIERISRGIYRVPAYDFDEEEQFRVATLRIGKNSAVCLLSALSLYGLTDSIPKGVWLLVPTKKHTRFRGVRLLRKRNPQLNIGIIEEDGYRITSIERTLAESLAERRLLGTNTGIQALRTAIAQKKTKLNKVADMAVKLGIIQKILPYIETFA